MTELSYLDSKKKTGDPRFWNRNAPTHLRAVTVFGVISYLGSAIVSLASTVIYLRVSDYDYEKAAIVLLISLVSSWLIMFFCLSWMYYQLVILSHDPPSPKEKIATRVYNNGKLEYTDWRQKGGVGEPE